MDRNPKPRVRREFRPRRTASAAKGLAATGPVAKGSVAKGSTAKGPTALGPVAEEASDRPVRARPDQEAVLGLQRTAGNQAVVGLVTGQRIGVQRAPTDDDRPPPTQQTAEQLGIVPGSALDTPLGRANRAEQLRRAAEHPSDQVTIQGGRQPGTTQVPSAQPDARARARAADYAPTYTGWTELGPDGRRARVESIINAQLAREGIPPVKVVFGAKAPGHAAFAADMWTMALSKQSIDAQQTSPQEFATLVDNAVHETQHVVTTFRGIRVAMDRNSATDKVYAPDRILAEATAANTRSHPDQELDQHALDEAFEIYQVSVEPERSSGRSVPPGGVDREAVLARKEAAHHAFADAQTTHDFNLGEARKHPKDPDRQAHVVDSAAALQQAKFELTGAHNGYISLPEETYSWRAGSAVKSAVLERITLQTRLDEARAQSSAAAAQQRALRAKGDVKGAGEALRRSQEAQQAATLARAQLQQLTSQEGKPADRLGRHDVPLTKAEMANAPKAPRAEDAAAGAGSKAGGGATPRPAESSPYPTGSGQTHASAGAPESSPAVTSGAIKKGDASKAAATIAAGPQPQDGAKRTVVAAPGGGIGVDWAKEGGDAAHQTEKGGGIAIGGDNTAAISGRSSRPTTVGDASGTTTTTGGVALTKDGGLEAKLGKTEEIIHGVDAKGEPIKSTRSTTGGVSLTDQGLGANAGTSTTGPTGTTRTATAGFTADAKGNASAQVGAGLSGQSGSGVTTTFKAGHQVDAGEPVEVKPGVFEVTYSVTDSRAMGAGGTASRTSTGPSVGGTVGTSQASSQTGVRRFTSKAEALRFKDNAALMIELGSGSAAPTTVAGALAIPIGETRGSGEAEGSNWGVSASYGATIGYGEQKTTSHQLAVRRVAEELVEVTAVVSRDKVKDWSISGGITNTKGSSKSSAFSVTFRFNLGTKEGRSAFEVYTKTGLPNAAASTLVSMTESAGAEDHDKVGVGPLGQAQWTGRTFESTTTSDQGVSQVFGGEKAHDQTPGTFGKLLGEDELHSSALLSSRQENGKEAGYTAEVKVKSDSGAYNRDKFGEIFLGAQKGKSEAKASGEWTLSAEIKKEVVHELERNSSRFRGAKTNDEKMRILSEIVKENGAGAAGGMVRSGANSKLAWTLELKGDDNFPGAAGQTRLKEQQQKLNAILVSTPGAADSVVREAKEAMDRLQARRKEVSREDKYTDLPEELRQQQLALIDDHLRNFRAIHQRALTAAVKTNPAENADVTSAKVADPRAYSELKPDQREADQLRDRSSTLQNDIDKIGKEIFEASKAVHRGAQSVATDVTSRQLNTQTASWKATISTAYELDRRQSQFKTTADGLRETWHNATDPKARTEKLRALVACLDERLKLMTVQLYQVRSAAAAIKPMTTETAMAANPAFWAGISADELPED